MSIRAFDLALAARRDADLAAALSGFAPFLDLCRHAVQRQAFGAKALTWSASREPMGLSVLLRGDLLWSVIAGEPAGRWLVSAAGVQTRMTKAEAVAHLARTLASAATTVDGVRFAWRKDDTIGGTF
jgi:hypothetical protein